MNADASQFSLVRGGPFYRLLRATGLARGDRWDPLRQIVVAIALTWLPMIVLSLILTPPDAPHLDPLQNVALHARLLVALPAFLMAEASLHMRTQRFFERFVGGNWAPGQEAAIARITATSAQLRDAILPEALLAVGAVALSQAVLWGAAEPLGGGERDGPGAYTPALVWYACVSLPLLLFLATRWLWRWGIWSLVLFRLAMLPIRPIPTHPDERGGLEFLSEPSVGFSWVVLGNSAVLVGAAANRIVAGHETLDAFIPHAFVYAVVSLVLAFGPLTAFTHQMWRAYFEGMKSYGALAADYTRRFQRRWIEGVDAGELLGTSDIQSLADLANSYAVLRRMKLHPVTKRAAIAVAASALLPFGFLLLTEVRLLELLRDMGAAWLERSTH